MSSGNKGKLVRILSQFVLTIIVCAYRKPCWSSFTHYCASRFRSGRMSSQLPSWRLIHHAFKMHGNCRKDILLWKAKPSYLMSLNSGKLCDICIQYIKFSHLSFSSHYRPNLVLNHTALLVYCLIESGLVQTLIEVIVTSDTFISVRATILLGLCNLTRLSYYLN